MIDSLWITGIYLFAVLVGTLTKFSKNIYYAIYTGYFGAMCFIFGGLHEMFYAELLVSRILGVFCFLSGIYLGGLWEGLENRHRKFEKEMDGFNQRIKDLKDEYRQSAIERLWHRRN